MQSVTVHVESMLISLRWVGVIARAIALEAGAGEDGAGEVELAVVEAVTNCIEHAYQNEPQRRVAVRFTASDTALEVDIEDSGIAMPRAQLKAAEFSSPEALEEGGRGLALIKALMTDVTYDSRETTNTLHMRRVL
jgi:serine/threonine-protein kinase RsbW